MVTHTYSRRKINKPGKVANLAHCQLNGENEYFPGPRSSLKIWPHETGSAVPSRVSLLISIHRLNMVLPHGIPPSSAAAFIHLFKTAIRHRVSSEFIGPRKCVRMAFNAESSPRNFRTNMVV